MAEIFAAIKLFLKLWPTLKMLVKEGGDIAEDIQVKQGKDEIRLVFKNQSEQDEETIDDETSDNASDLNDVFRK